MLRIVRLGLLLAVLLAAWVALLQRTAGEEAIHTAVLLAPLAAVVLFGAVLVCQLLYGVATFRTVPEEAELLQKDIARAKAELGSSELQTILGAAARRSQLVLVDFSASWCGPCRMMLPVLQQLAQELCGRLAVVKVDCEQTSANQALASSSGIRAFPTFHLYRAQQKVGELRGADPAGLRRAIDQQLALLGPSSGGASTSGGASGMSAAGMAMCNALAQALARVKAGCSYDEFVAAAKTLLTFVSNVIDQPGEEKFRRVKASNAAYQSKLGCRPGGKEAMAAIGFKEMMEAGEAVLVMNEVPSELPRVRQLLQSALQQAEAAAAAMGGRGSSGTSAAGARPAAGAAGGAGTAAGRQRIVRVTPRKLAKVLEKCLAEVGVGQVAQQAQQAQQTQQEGSQGGGQP
ncbi:Thioredoxin chloroplastic [Chlorella sorokiniana]|uniref:Thioredoxin chloroplastic n=1 Tax=Chlorella sorokiniana TaxID=3076 RepID=A0A2P6TUA4_CHLSO|nr:Thioredoxin chloroplastic [Chlorella sorokiniana]|eukprot:PRW57641.1 Thioredoxin chloroplastic [Chlorella sorokiniana]